MSRKRKYKKRSTGDKCKYLYIDYFGHPFCTASAEIALDCKFCLPSEEYQIMMDQIKFQKPSDNKSSNMKVPSTYRCTKLDEYADAYGHLPPRMRSKPPKGFMAVTGEY